MIKPIIQLENISKYYTGAGGIGLGLRKVNAQFQIGEFVIITGPSGSGKTTMLNVISGMDTYEEGILYVNGEDTTYFGSKDYEEYRRDYISFIFQNFNLIESYTVYENVELALIARGVSKKDRKKQIETIIDEVGLTNRKKHRVTQLSGGEKQRVAIARAFASDAPIIVCDEITGNLDSQTGLEIIALLKKVSKGKLVLLVTHDPDQAIQYATRMITMHDGMIENNRYLKQIEEPNRSLNIKESKPIDNKTVWSLSLKTLLRTPRKTLLMLMILLVATLLCAFAYSLYANSNDAFEGGISVSRDTFTYYPGRVVIKKTDNSVFTNNDYQFIESIPGVINLIKGDLALDQGVRYYLNSIEYSTTFSSVRSSTDLKRQDLAYGELPKAANEIIIETRKERYGISLDDLVGQKVRMAVDNVSGARDMTIVGVRETVSNEFVYLHPALLLEMQQSSMTRYSKVTFKVDENDIKYGYLPFGNEMIGMNIAIKPGLSVNDIEVNAYMPEGEFPTIKTDFIFQNLYQKATIPNLNLIVKPIGKNEIEYYDWRSSVESNYEYYNTIYMAEENIQKLGLDQVYQVSVTTDEKDAKRIALAIEKGQFYAIPITPNTSSYFNGSSIILQIVMTFLVIGLIIGIYFLTFLSLRNIVYSHQKSYLVMRSLGIDGGKISLQVFFNLIILTIIAFFQMFIIWVFARQRRRMNIFEPLMKLSLSQLLFVGLIIISIALILANRFAKRILAQTIVAKEME